MISMSFLPSEKSAQPVSASRSRDGSTDRGPMVHPLSATPDGGLSRQSSNTSASTQAATPKYVKQYQTLLEHQRQVFDEERALWQIERADLLHRINELEILCDQNQSASVVSSTFMKNRDRNISSWSTAASNGSRHTSTGSTGEEVWRGSNPTAQPTRTFSEASNPTGIKQGDRLPSIAEDEKATGKKISFSENETLVSPPPADTHKPSIHGSLLSRNLDGINFKSSGLPPSIVQKISSPVRSPPTPPDLSPNTVLSPPRVLQFPAHDPYTKDAGHTPRPRNASQIVLDGTGLSSGNEATPIKVEVERPPLEPRQTSIRVPSERQDSYFPPPADAQDTSDGAPPPQDPPAKDKEAETDQDPSLTGPLGLTNDVQEDGHFLSELDSKLNAAVNAAAETVSPPDSQTLSPPQANGRLAATSNSDASQQLNAQSTFKDGDTNENVRPEATKASDANDQKEPSTPPQQTSSEVENKGGNDVLPEEKKVQTPDSEPRLRMKRSMNFGSAFGEKSVGRGF